MKVRVRDVVVEGKRGGIPQARERRMRVGPGAAGRVSWSVSMGDSAADGIGSSTSSKPVLPVCGGRLLSVPAERIRKAFAPLRIAADGPPQRTPPALR